MPLSLGCLPAALDASLQPWTPPCNLGHWTHPCSLGRLPAVLDASLLQQTVKITLCAVLLASQCNLEGALIAALPTRSRPRMPLLQEWPWIQRLQKQPVHQACRSSPRYLACRSPPGCHACRSSPGCHACRSSPGCHTCRSSPGCHTCRSGPGCPWQPCCNIGKIEYIQYGSQVTVF